MTNYVERVREELRKRIDDYDEWGEDASTLLDLYAVLAITKGRQTTMEDIHDSWSLWTNRVAPEHRSLVPFGHLSEEIAEYDRPYMAAVHEVATMLDCAKDLTLSDSREDAHFGLDRSQAEYEQAIWQRFDSLTI